MPVLARKTRVWRIADRGFPLYSGYGAMIYGGRWNSPGTEVIYAAKSLEGALLELRVHTAGLPPPKKHGYIWIDLPAGLSYDVMSRSSLPNWRNLESQTRAYGDHWARTKGSFLLIVPSVIVPAPYTNLLINPNHPEAASIKYLRMPKPLSWDSRLFE